MNKQLLLALIPFVLAACASTSEPTTNAAREERVYRTGSNVPARDAVSSSPITTANPSAMPQGTAPRVN